MSETLHASALCKNYGARSAVRDVRLAVAPGEIVGLLGPNGAGKTTTFNMIVGRIRPTSGRVFLGDDEITHLPMYQRARKGITYLPQEPSIFRKLTVEENVLAILESLPLRAPRALRARGPAALRLRPAGQGAPEGLARCPAASAGASRSRARWCSSRATCCSTSRLPASIRSR